MLVHVPTDAEGPFLKNFAYAGFFYHLLLAWSAHVAAADGPEMMVPAASGLVLLAAPSISTAGRHRATAADSGRVGGTSRPRADRASATEPPLSCG